MIYLSEYTVNELKRLGYNVVPTRLPRPDCCFKVFFNSQKHLILTIVKESSTSEDWLVSVFDRFENHLFDLSEIEGYVIDAKQLVHFKNDVDIIPFVETLNSKVNRII